MARGGEDVSPGKTFGDTPPLPGKTPVWGFIIHVIDYTTLVLISQESQSTMKFEDVVVYMNENESQPKRKERNSAKL